MSKDYLDMTHPLQLLRGSTLVGTLTVTDVDQPWFICTFTPTVAYKEVMLAFDEENRLIDALNQGEQIASSQLDEAMERIYNLGFTLMDKNGLRVEPLIHIGGIRANFRY